MEPTFGNHPSPVGGHPSLPVSAVLRRCHLQLQTVACRGRNRVDQGFSRHTSSPISTLPSWEVLRRPMVPLESVLEFKIVCCVITRQSWEEVAASRPSLK